MCITQNSALKGVYNWASRVSAMIFLVGEINEIGLSVCLSAKVKLAGKRGRFFFLNEVSPSITGKGLSSGQKCTSRLNAKSTRNKPKQALPFLMNSRSLVKQII